MANTNAPFGYWPSRKIPGSGMDFGMTTRLIKGTSTQAVFRGDLLIWDGGNAGFVTADTSPGTGIIVGVAWGFQYLQTGQGGCVVPWNSYFPGSGVASGDVQVLVIDDPNAIFMAQCGATALTQADVGKNVQAVYTAGNTANGNSKMSLNTSTATTSTLPFQVYNILGAPVTDNTSAYNLVEVTFNNEVYKQLTSRS